MSLKKKFENTSEIIGEVLNAGKYKLIALISGIVVFGLLYYLFVAKVADNDIWISVMMSGPAFVTFSIVTILITSALTGILFSMLFFKFSLYKQIEGQSFFGFMGSGIAAFGVGCPTCGAFVFGLVGMPLALMYFPFRGLELQVLGIFILMGSIYFIGKSIRGVCKIK